MEKPVAAIEFCSKKLKLVVGYELNGQVYCIYSFTKDYGRLIESGKVSDANVIIGIIKDIKNISDGSERIKLNIQEALLAMPPLGIEIFQTKQVTTVISEDKKINTLDTKNIYALIRNGTMALENELIDIIPEHFILDQGQAFTVPPYGQYSTTLCVDAKIHTLPKRISAEYQNILNNGGISVKKPIIAPFAACKLIGADKNMPEEYLLVDIGSNLTTVSLVGNKQLFASRFFEWGGDNITNRMVESFNINESEAEKIKIIYGINKREMNFKVPICQTEDADGNAVKFYSSDLNEVIENELEYFVRKLDSSIESLLSEYDSSFKSLPIVLIGGGSKLNGLKDFLINRVFSDEIIIFTPNVLGARDSSLTNCLGMILASSMYPNINDDGHLKVGNISRDVTD